MGKLIAASMKMLYRDKQALFWALAFPLIFAVVFALFDFEQTPQIDVAVVAEQPSPVSTALVEGLGEIDGFTVKERASLPEARAALAGDEHGVVLAVPGPGRGEIRAFYNETNFDENQFALNAVRQIVDATNLRLAGISAPSLTVEAIGVEAKSVQYYDFLLPGIVALGVMSFSIIGMAVAVSRFREQRILKRILATPLSPVRFLSAQVAARLVLAVIQAAIILAVGVFLFGAKVYGNVLWMFVLVTLANLVFLNIGFALGGRAPNPDAAQGVGNAVALPMTFLSGVFFPTDTLPDVMRAVVAWLPLTPLIEALRTISIDGLSIIETGPQLAMLGGWVVASFLIAGRMFRFGRA